MAWSGKKKAVAALGVTAVAIGIGAAIVVPNLGDDNSTAHTHGKEVDAKRVEALKKDFAPVLNLSPANVEDPKFLEQVAKFEELERKEPKLAKAVKKGKEENVKKNMLKAKEIKSKAALKTGNNAENVIKPSNPTTEVGKGDNAQAGKGDGNGDNQLPLKTENVLPKKEGDDQVITVKKEGDDDKSKEVKKEEEEEKKVEKKEEKIEGDEGKKGVKDEDDKKKEGADEKVEKPKGLKEGGNEGEDEKKKESDEKPKEGEDKKEGNDDKKKEGDDKGKKGDDKEKEDDDKKEGDDKEDDGEDKKPKDGDDKKNDGADNQSFAAKAKEMAFAGLSVAASAVTFLPRKFGF